MNDAPQNLEELATWVFPARPVSWGYVPYQEIRSEKLKKKKRKAVKKARRRNRKCKHFLKAVTESGILNEFHKLLLSIQ